MLFAPDLNQLQPLLESEKQLTKLELIKRSRISLDPKQSRTKNLLQLINQLDFCSVIKDRFGRILFL